MLKSRIPQIAAALPLRMDKVMDEGAHWMKDTAKQYVHVDTRDLHDAIHVEKLRQGRYLVMAGNKEVFYGHMEEFGTSHSPPHPFMVPAFETHKDDIVDLARFTISTL